MKILLYPYLILLGLLQTAPLIAQTNYIVTGPNATGPGDYNVFLGVDAAIKTTTGSYNAFIGYRAGVSNTTGYNNSFVGYTAGYYNTTGIYNTIMGYQAGYYNTSGGYNTFIGTNAGLHNMTGIQNTFIGSNAGYYTGSGSQNTFVGFNAGQNVSGGNFNTYMGTLAGLSTDAGSFNAFFGYETGYDNRGGSQNTFIGSRAGRFNSTGNQNSFYGYQAGYSNTTGTNNTFLGYQAGQNVTTGSNNIIVGPTSGTAIIDGSDNVLMGYNSQATDGLHNAIAIGSGTRVAISNALILGNEVNVGIGTTAPATRLEVVSPSTDQSGLRLSRLTSHSKASQSTDEFLTVNEKGDVIKARYQLRISDSSQWSDKVFSPTYKLRPLNEVADYVRRQRHLPGVPSAEQVQHEGVDLVKMNSLLLEKVEELTLYNIEQQSRIDKLERLVKELLQKK